MPLHRLLLIATLLSGLTALRAQSFEDHFIDATLRIDYVLSGNHDHQSVSVNELQRSEHWYGRRVNMDRLLLEGNGQFFLRDTLDGHVLYCQSFSTLFQEWISTEEATRVSRSFEHPMLAPMPLHKVDAELILTDSHGRQQCAIRHRIDPTDILIRPSASVFPWKYIGEAGDSRERIDLVFVPEGYTADEMARFEKDCEASIGALLHHEPFWELKDRFNFVALMAPSATTGVSIPHDGQWVNTLLHSSFDTFYSNRYLTTLRLFDLHDALAGVPAEHIIILANTDNYGGGGIYNSYLLSAAHNEHHLPVVVHEFGHSFAGLADEYYYDDQYETMYPADREPWEPNITTLVDFQSKWADMLPKKTPIPTKPTGKDIYTALGVYEGAGYQSKGVYRPVQECRMKINAAPSFCPVCTRAIRRIVDYQCPAPVR